METLIDHVPDKDINLYDSVIWCQCAARCARPNQEGQWLLSATFARHTNSDPASLLPFAQRPNWLMYPKKKYRKKKLREAPIDPDFEFQDYGGDYGMDDDPGGELDLGRMEGGAASAQKRPRDDENLDDDEPEQEDPWKEFEDENQGNRGNQLDGPDEEEPGEEDEEERNDDLGVAARLSRMADEFISGCRFEPNSEPNFQPPPPPPNSRLIPEELLAYVELWCWKVQDGCTDAGFTRLLNLSFVRDKNRPSLSLARLTTIVTKLSRIKVITHHVCRNLCVNYSDPKYQQLDSCPECSAPRYKLGSLAPFATAESFDIDPFITALYSNKATSADIIEWHQHTINLIESGDRFPLISDTNSATMLLNLRKSPEAQELLTTSTILGVFSSDGLDLVPERDPTKKVYAHLSSFHPLSTSISFRFKYRNNYTVSVYGSKKLKDVNSFITPFVQNAKELETPKLRWNATLRKWTKERVLIAFDRADSPEQASKMGLCGASGACSCLWCTRLGVLAGSHFYPASFIPHGDNPLLDLDLPLLRDNPSVNAPGTVRLDSLLRTRSQHLETVAALDKARDKRADFERIRRDSGITGLGVFEPLLFYQQLHSHFFPIDYMHLWHKNVLPNTYKLLIGATRSALETPILSAWDRQVIDALQMTSSIYKPTDHAQSTRSLLLKFGDYSCWQVREVFAAGLLFWTDGLVENEQALGLIPVLAKLTRLLECKHIDPTPFPEDFDFETLDLNPMRDDGKDVCPLPLLEYLLQKFILLFESIFINRDATYVSLANPSHHRILHFPLEFLLTGPSFVASQYQLEGIIGWLKNKVNSRLHAAANMSNVAKRLNILILIELQYDNIDVTPIPTTSSYSFQTFPHPLLPNTFLHHPKQAKNPRFSDSEALLLRNWEISENVKRVENGVLSIWGRAQLGNGQSLRTRWSEGEEPLSDETPWRSFLPDKAEFLESLKGKGDGSKSKKKKKRKDKKKQAETVRSPEIKDNKSNRFALVTLSQGSPHRACEIIKFVEIQVTENVSGKLEPNPRFLALVDVLPELHSLHNIGEFFYLDEEREQMVIGVESIRCSISLQFMNPEGERERIGVARKAGRDSTEFKDIKTWV